MVIHFEIHPDRVENACNRHRWLIEIIDRAVCESKNIRFYKEIQHARTKDDFCWTIQLFHHSQTLPRFIAEALLREPDDELRLYYAAHLWEEAPHSNLLAEWMCQKLIVKSNEELSELRERGPDDATATCINFGRQLAEEYDWCSWLVGINFAIEKCSYMFFSEIVNVLKALEDQEKGWNHKYFEVHVEADERHSTEAMVFVPPIPEGSEEADRLRGVALKGISLWCGMLNSWVGVDHVPKFNNEGAMDA